MTTVTIKRGPNANDLNAFLKDVQYIKGVGSKRAASIYAGTHLTFDIAPEAHEATVRQLRRLALDGTLIVEGLLGIEASTEASTTAKNETAIGSTNTANPANDLAEAINRVLQGAVSEDRVRDIVKRSVEEAMAGIPTTRIELERKGMEPVELEGLHHPMFTRLLKMLSCRAANGYVPNVWIAGEKSSGKSHAGRAAAAALGLPFYTMGTLAMAHEAIGFVDGNGKYHSTPFVDAFIGGGVLQMDEIDSYEAHPTLTLNGPLANNCMTLPDGRFVERHKDCIIIGGANTWGMGATSDYIGRNKLDAAFLSRFPARLVWNIDPALEQAFCGNVQWAIRVQAARARAKAAGLKIGIDTRHSSAGAAFIAGGFTPDEAADMTYLAGLSDEQRKIIEGV
jgi:hypothetical protein